MRTTIEKGGTSFFIACRICLLLICGVSDDLKAKGGKEANYRPQAPSRLALFPWQMWPLLHGNASPLTTVSPTNKSPLHHELTDESPQGEHSIGA